MINCKDHKKLLNIIHAIECVVCLAEREDFTKEELLALIIEIQSELEDLVVHKVVSQTMTENRAGGE